MNLLLLLPEELEAGGARARLRGARLERLREAGIPAPGGRLRVGVAGGRMGTGRVTQRDAAELVLELAFEADPPPPLPVTLLLALPRPKALRRVLASAAALGVKRIILFHCFRVENSYWQSPFLEPAALRETLAAGLEQACDTVLPEVTARRRFAPFVEDELPGLARGTRALAAHPAAERPCPRAVPGPMTLAIGPERGFLPDELERLAAAGFEPVTLGPRILRVETAVPTLLGRLCGS